MVWEIPISEPPTLWLIPLLIPCFAGAGSIFNKGGFYAPIKGARKWDLFAEGDSIVHRNNRRSVNNVYATSSMIDLEPYVDSAIQHFINILNAKQGGPLDLGLFLQLFAFGRAPE